MNQTRPGGHRRRRAEPEDLGTAEGLTLEGSAPDGWTFSGYGAGRIWIRGGRPGDTVNVRLSRLGSGRVEGRIQRVVLRATPSVDSSCPHFDTCGGCQWLDVAYATQRAWKRQMILDALSSRGIFLDVPEVLASPDVAYFRNRMDLSFGHAADGRLLLGLHARTDGASAGEAVTGTEGDSGFASIINVESCRLMSIQGNVLAGRVREALGQTRLRAYDTTTRSGVLRSLVVRESKTTGDIAAMLVVASSKHVDGQALADLLEEEIPRFRGLLVAVNRRRSRNDPPRSVTAYGGDGAVEETIGRLTFRTSSARFVQVNPGQAERLYATAVGMAEVEPGQQVLDLYAGSGGLSLFLAHRGARVTGVEVSREAMKEASINADLNGLGDRCTFIAGDAAALPAAVEAHRGRFQVVVVNPPRGGLAPSALAFVAGLEPVRVLYVSCNPGTLARDLVQFQMCGYEVSTMQPIDMFPHSGHVEVVVGLRRTAPAWR